MFYGTFAQGREKFNVKQTFIAKDAPGRGRKIGTTAVPAASGSERR
jgi:hypothetical protein